MDPGLSKLHMSDLHSIVCVPGIHGDEVVGRELLLYLARALCEQFSSDSMITELLSTTEIHLLPSLNTDGYILKTRNNANDKVNLLIFLIKH